MYRGGCLLLMCLLKYMVSVSFFLGPEIAIIFGNGVFKNEAKLRPQEEPLKLI